MRASPPERLSLAAARRIALHAQGFADPRPTGRVDRRHVRRVVERLGVIQLDSVNVLTRSHFLPFFSRLGPYPSHAIAELAEDRRELFEYWAHEASLLPVDLYPLFRWRMERAGQEAWGRMKTLGRERPDFVRAVLDEVTTRGPLPASELSDAGHRPKAGMWSWSDGKTALEWLFWSGQITAAGRRPSFERLYDLPERVLPPLVLTTPVPDPHAAQRSLLLRAARALGVATARDLADYFRIRPPEARPRLAELVELGSLHEVDVEGFGETAYLHPEARAPRRVEASALLSPFDSLVWERNRTERLFGMRLRLEIYTPAEKRVHGYYVLPFLLGETLVARVDLKADRTASTLRVQGAFAEAGHARPEVAAALARELRAMADWLTLERIIIASRGDLARLLARSVRSV
ncbi:winged helix-turn-helix domain-containing protein [Chondromyces crocatus]|uniref:Cytoplasmic protein n=1 Tax=Chondromyces crocatus TaxID=52 RepID=A0A0K1ESM9_CHOCO|nr:crosslink repair DNA glycosylase YcaQ family protein [Chondromyces crocatus]AKT43613.1 uncharacterized protein CMC5_078480 [Chondromyces crocatus]